MLLSSQHDQCHHLNLQKCRSIHTDSLAQWVECSSMVLETGVQYQIDSNQRLKKKMVLDTSLLNTQHYVSRVKWTNPGKGVVPSHTPRCSSYRKGSLRIMSMKECFKLKVKVKLATIVEGDPKAPFSIATTPRCRGGRYSFPGLLHFTLDPYLIMLSVKQGGIKYHFLSLWYDSTWDWTQVSRAIGKHSNRLANEC